jgi:hypothetical protein
MLDGIMNHAVRFRFAVRKKLAMLKRFLTWSADLTWRKVLLWGLAAAVLFEAITLILRFGFSLESTRETAMIGTMTLGLRIHHAYIGILLMPLGWCFPRGIRNALWIVGIGLILSDAAHHFLVLWPIVGSPQFDLVYPNHPWWS